MTKSTHIKQTKRTLFAILTMVIAVAVIHLESLQDIIKINDDKKPEVLEVEINTPKSPGKEVEYITISESEENISTEELAPVQTEKTKPDNSIVVKDIEVYLLHIKTISILISKFNNNLDYKDDLSYLESSINYPKKISDILKDLRIYRDNYLVTKNERYNQVKLQGSLLKRLLNKIVDIKAVNPTYASMEEAHKKVALQIGILEDYFYSKDFLNRYLAHD